MLNGLEYSEDPNNFFVKVHSPRRKYADFRTECYEDALTLKTLGPVYVLFSTGIDSQIIARSFIDAGVDAEYIFLNYKNYSVELDRIHECEKFYNINVKKIDLDIESYKKEWLRDTKKQIVPALRHYPFDWLSKNLDSNFPIITQGATDPSIIGLHSYKISVYCNYYEPMQQRLRMMKKHRSVYDFPFSPESTASFYSNSCIETFCNTINYFKENALSKNKKLLRNSEFFTYFAKPFILGNAFKNDIIWYGKQTGYEKCPRWFLNTRRSIFDILETRVSIPLSELKDFLENNINVNKIYKDWIYKGSYPEFISLRTITL